MINFVSIGNRWSCELVSLAWRGSEIIHDAPLGTWRGEPWLEQHRRPQITNTQRGRAEERARESLFALMPNRFGPDVWACNELISRHGSSTEGGDATKALSSYLRRKFYQQLQQRGVCFWTRPQLSGIKILFHPWVACVHVCCLGAAARQD